MKIVRKCKYCNVDLKRGKAVDFTKPNIKSVFAYYNIGKLIDCWKCPKCGYSEE